MLKTAIPFIDLRGKSPIDLLRMYPDKAHALVRASRRTYGVWSHLASLALLPLADRLSHRWLLGTKNPYLYEIESFAGILGGSGMFALNLSYEWGCTTGAFRDDHGVTLLRVLDWVFPSLGEHALVVLQQGRAGEFYNITWPGVSGVFTAMAPGRFAAAINQAPMRKHRLYLAGDWIKNRIAMHKENALPPAHLLRQVCEQAEDYDMAKNMLMSMPVAAPVIYTLTGIQPGQGCVIERLERAVEVRELSARLQVATANHFNSALAEQGHGWRPREIDSAGRYKQICSLTAHDLQSPHFEWLHAPMLNANTRLAVIADAAASRLMVQGFAGTQAVTEVFNLPEAEYEGT